MNREAVEITIRVIPKSRQQRLGGWYGDALKIYLRSPPEKGAANEELLTFLAKILHIPSSHLTLIQGKTSKNKRVRVEGIAWEAVQQRLNEKLESTK